LRVLAGLLRLDLSNRTDGNPTLRGIPSSGAVHRYKGLRASGSHSDTEALQLTIPMNVFLASGLQGIDCALGNSTRCHFALHGFDDFSTPTG
jgi:hypothetical protein